MLFNSYIYIFLFFPAVFTVYFCLNRYSTITVAKVWLAVSSLAFYAYWQFEQVLIILFSISLNYMVSYFLERNHGNDRSMRRILAFGVIFNMTLLGYYKYLDFIIVNLNGILGLNLPLLRIELPLGISFFTFTQIAFLVDCVKKPPTNNALNYLNFVTFFPHLLAGPIIHHKNIMPQFDDLGNKRLNYKNICLGLVVFSIGLFKKCVIADSLSSVVSDGFDLATHLNCINAWVTSLSYTFQIYFDFSGYTDMAIGSALMLNIVFPDNFNSPYKATDLQGFWRRWHMTLSAFLRDYIYIPLGGNRSGKFRTYTNIFLTFLIGGIWHGAGWTFVFWGVMHGLGVIVHRIWSKTKITLPKWLAWFITFNTVNVLWVFFRAKSFDDALKVVRGMVGLDGINLPRVLEKNFAFLSHYGIEFGGINIEVSTACIIVFSFIATLFLSNSIVIRGRFVFNKRTVVFTSFCITVGILFLNRQSEFLYFKF